MKLAHWQGVQVQTVKDRVTCIESVDELNVQVKDIKDMNHKQLLYFLKLNHRILGFGATPHGIAKKSQEEKTGQEIQEKNNTRREDGRIPQRSSHTWHRSQLFFFGTKKFMYNTSLFVENPSRTFWSLFVNHREALDTVLLLLDMFPVAAGIAERVGGAAALFMVIVSSFFFLISVILHIYRVFPSNVWLPKWKMEDLSILLRVWNQDSQRAGIVCHGLKLGSRGTVWKQFARTLFNRIPVEATIWAWVDRKWLAKHKTGACIHSGEAFMSWGTLRGTSN